MAAALALVGCSKSELVDTPVQEQNAIAFDTYVGRDAQTRATIVDLDVVKLKGFGVNAYYNAEFTTDDDGQITGFTYDDTFMHNTKVTYNDEKGVWTYSPIKYWPNNVDDHLTFFAYAPYDKSNPGLGEGNVDMSKIYDFTIAENVKDQIDLVYHKAFGEDGDMTTADNGQTYQMKKQKIMDKVRFNFQHALSRISFDVKAVVDDINDESDNLLDGNTHINIKEVALVKVSDDATDDPFYKTATLDMTTGQWIYDEEAGYQEYHMTGEDFYRPVEVKTKYTDAWGDPWYESEYVAQLSKFNPAQRLLADDHYLMILPQEFEEGSGYRIYIEYDVISEEVNNNGIGENTTEDSSTITNKIYSEVLDGAFEQGKAYKFTLWLGMTSVKIDATETAWTEEDNMNIWMPENCAFDVDAQGNLLIKTAEDLAMFRTLINNGSWYVTDEGEELQYAYASYLQTEDIDLSSVLGGEDNDYWNPIGVDGADGPDNPTIFCGTYDGGGHTVSNVNIHNKYDNSAYMSGLFYKTRDVTIKNLNVEGSMIDCWGHWVGGVVGWADGESTIENCHFSGSIVLAENSKGSQSTGFLGGVVGQIYSGKVIACSNNAEIYAPVGSSIPIGGVVGDAGSAEIIGCYNTGMIDVDSNNNTIGGIVGKTSAAVTSCYNKGNIFIDNEATGNSVGSIIGSGGTPSYCYYTDDEFSAVSGADDSSYTSVKNVSFSDVADDGKSTIAPWLNYGLNGDANNLSGYEYYVNYSDLKIQAGNDAGKEPPVKVMQWVDSGLKHVDDVIQITSARDLAIARDLVNNGTKSFFESGGSVYKYVQVEVEAEDKDTAEEDKEGSGYFYSGSYKQTADINFLDLIDDKDYSADASNWTPMGFVSRYFTGKFDGNTFEIKNLEITDIGDDNNYAGLFGFVENATLSNIKIVSCNINIIKLAAAIAGRALGNTTITNCTVGTESNKQATIYGGDGAAGIICDPNNTTFVNCTNYASITSSGPAGGITNRAGESTFENCSNYGTVTSGTKGDYATAGICATDGTKFVNCHNYNTISGGYVGGIVAYAKAGAVIYGSHNEGAINSSYAGAGICCAPWGSVTLRSCYNTADRTGTANFSAGLIARANGTSESSMSYSMTACYNTGKDYSAALVDFITEADEAYINLNFTACYYTNADSATVYWEGDVTGATKFEDSTHLWFGEKADAGDKTIVMNAMNDVLIEADDVQYESNGDDANATATATHPLIHKAN